MGAFPSESFGLPGENGPRLLLLETSARLQQDRTRSLTGLRERFNNRIKNADLNYVFASRTTDVCVALPPMALGGNGRGVEAVWKLSNDRGYGNTIPDGTRVCNESDAFQSASRRYERAQEQLLQRL